MDTTITLPLKDQWIALHKEQPRVRIRDGAKQLGSTEAGVLAAFAGSRVIRLDGSRLRDLWKRMPELGFVMALTRNESCVHERKGIFEEITLHGPNMGVVVGADIDLRMFFQPWTHGFAVFEDAEAGFKQSFQIFDAQGTAIIKVFLTDQSNQEAYTNIVREFEANIQSTELIPLPAPVPHQHADGGVDATAFRQAWSELKDTHDFFPMLKKFNVSRVHALRIAGDFARKLSNDTVKQLLEHAAATDLEIMVFVGNHGNIQIHTGPVKKILEIPNWINVMDPLFNLHLRLDHIDSVWMVKKPTEDGPVHSVEVFDASGELIVQFFGKRKPGSPELSAWSAFAAGLQ
ncbi:hemin-degrading factor [Pseudobacter ginsenosidimutans]|jgi:putative hemin transport protein|uniref:Putative hemin transport protein n=1 Tax=Pseudobacter ginsenosidimutans TaxID=661488 RepID=A0A4Q7MRV1_9BACT|nr:ChuX/HutX family heme-like substrate-binding protein [Pseudobacter ginsenosidimutans]QEC41855.1 hemin-degrading factor [Pseudobacter ginsenosidimutans]RZS71327.1 putative hemin transport protein [Pseudobacter ginsenosidimutans]